MFTGENRKLSENKAVPEVVDFLLKVPLYEVFNYSSENLGKGLKLYQFNDSFDCFCPECNSYSIFKPFYFGARAIHSNLNHWVDKEKFEVHAKCSRNSKHGLYFLFEAKGTTIKKIG